MNITHLQNSFIFLNTQKEQYYIVEIPKPLISISNIIDFENLPLKNSIVFT